MTALFMFDVVHQNFNPCFLAFEPSSCTYFFSQHPLNNSLPVVYKNILEKKKVQNSFMIHIKEFFFDCQKIPLSSLLILNKK
jgi:hypothetical protein